METRDLNWNGEEIAMTAKLLSRNRVRSGSGMMNFWKTRNGEKRSRECGGDSMQSVCNNFTNAIVVT